MIHILEIFLSSSNNCLDILKKKMKDKNISFTENLCRSRSKNTIYRYKRFMKNMNCNTGIYIYIYKLFTKYTVIVK